MINKNILADKEAFILLSSSGIIEGYEYVIRKLIQEKLPEEDILTKCSNYLLEFEKSIKENKIRQSTLKELLNDQNTILNKTEETKKIEYLEIKLKSKEVCNYYYNLRGDKEKLINNPSKNNKTCKELIKNVNDNFNNLESSIDRVYNKEEIKSFNKEFDFNLESENTTISYKQEGSENDKKNIVDKLYSLFSKNPNKETKVINEENSKPLNNSLIDNQDLKSKSKITNIIKIGNNEKQERDSEDIPEIEDL